MDSTAGFDGDQMDQLGWMFLDNGMAAVPLRIAKRYACLSVHRLAAAARHDAGIAVGGLDMARRGGVG